MAGAFPNSRTDEELETMLADTSDWVVYGRQGTVLCQAASLHHGLRRSAEYANSGAIVIALCRLPSDNIVVFPEQIARLRELIARREEMPANGTSGPQPARAAAE